ncbi:putative arylsulfatase [Caenibius tardaugens NBRC 16725]|uniref:Putative arylsulfatase n=1 Tax=Caenibius tardaugens NBRC 16725 TaxID=1219035 RepID=U2ZZY0_9SPHN|nr:arylsulfatase [Caenibius tardaugens]AZI37926.1 arylsulfatase [Caenibius tardaugens NBRC 16725]GAD50939.1 putative arylsulfatase [Caenibius tardaugens NBRC 16725]
MIRRLFLPLITTAAFTGVAHAEEPAKPNFLIIVADDLGFSDIGAFGGEIATPNLDQLAASGTKLTAFHTAPTCSPTRSMLLSGTDNHRAGLGTMAELIAPNQKGKQGHEGYLRAEVAALPELLRAGGYRTLQSGKWHLGLAPEQDPHARGFQYSFTLLQGGHNHFGGSLVPGAPNSTTNTAPTSFNATYRENGKLVTKLPDNFYSSDTFTTKLIEQLKTSKAGKDGSKPFFAYLTYTAPHWPLQAPREEIGKYHGKYDAGYDVLRQQRLRRQIALGLLDPAVAAHETGSSQTPWDKLSPEEQRLAARDMEIYAAMIDRLDQNVGRVIQTLKETGEYDNTVILFLSDNGAEGANIAQSKQLGILAAHTDNRLENRGNANSFVAYGPGWAQAATAPSWLYKAYASEGGTRAVSFITGKAVGSKRPIANAFLSVADVVPTFLDLAGIPAPKGTFDGRKVEPIRGKSWVSYLKGKARYVYSPRDAYGVELFGSRALRQGDWKVTDIGDGQWKLFNIAKDPGETNDLSAQEPRRLAQLKNAWERYAQDVGVILPEGALYRP